VPDAGDQGPPESPPQRPAGAGGHDDGPPAAGEEDHGSPAATEAGPAGEAGPLLTDLARLRRQARTARHAYWFPLVLFGLLTCGAAPLYVVAATPPPASGAFTVRSGPILLGAGCAAFLVQRTRRATA
jgi:hypothetical protein